MYHHDASTIKEILLSRNITVKSSSESNIEKFAKSIRMLDQDGNVLETFPSGSAAAKFLFYNEYTKSKVYSGGIQQHIVQVCNKERKIAYGFC